jgi:hypothetical protein
VTDGQSKPAAVPLPNGRASSRELLNLVEGDRIELLDGSVRVVTSNPRDGVWILCQGPDSSVGGDELVPLTDVRNLRHESA